MTTQTPQTPQPPQVIGPRTIENPKFEIVWIQMKDEQSDPYANSLETCGCGYSCAAGGVGYWHPDGWQCKQCLEVHTPHTSERDYIINQVARITAAGYPEAAQRYRRRYLATADIIN